MEKSLMPMRDLAPVRRAGELAAQGLQLEIIAYRLGVSKGHASKLLKLAREISNEDMPPRS